MVLESDIITLALGGGSLPLPTRPHLRLASGNFWPEQGESQSERQPTAGLFIIDTRTSPSRQEHVRVRPSQVLEVEGLTLEILEVGSPRDEVPAIRLRVRAR
jgi:hypothetical protein